MTSMRKPAPFDFKTQYSLGFSAQDEEIVVDFFCGGGGAGTGLEMGLGRSVTVAKNYSPAAISMHTVNHPGARHFTTDVFAGDPQGVLPDRDCLEGDDEIAEYVQRKKLAKTVEALWSAEHGYSWTYKTAIPHATFEVMEGGDRYYRGIVFSLADLGPQVSP